jgi:hypothetical protein
MKRTTAVALHVSRYMLSKTGYGLVRMGRFLAKKATIVEIICALHIILFIYTGINKIMDHEKFKLEMGRSPFIQNIASFIAVAIPAGELLIALALIIKPTRLLGLYLSFFLMALFTGYIWLMLTYAYDLPCSCGGVLAKMSWNDHLYFNAGFTVLAMIAAIFQSKMNTANSLKQKLTT